MKNKFLLLTTVLCSGVFNSLAFPAFAETKDAELEELLSLDLNELTVSVASKREEKIDDAPGVMNVLTREEIERSGAKNLMEAVERLPDFTLNGIISQKDINAALRGVGGYGTTRVLLLMNGRPMREGYIGGLDKLVYEAFPLELVERVELIRGPGSVLYGTNAFAGVINIVTRKPTEARQGAAAVSYGSFDTPKAEFNYGGKKESFTYNVAGEASRTQGYNGDMFDSTGAFIEDDYKSSFHDFAGTAEYKNFRVNAFSAFTDEDTAGFPHIGNFTQSTYRQHFIDLGYTQELNKNWGVNYNASYTTYDYDFGKTPTSFTRIQSETNDFLGEISVSGKINEKTNTVFGVTYQRITGDEQIANAEWDIYRLNGYAQLDYMARDWLKLIGGVQYNKVQDADYNLSGRAAAVVDFSEHWGSKIMYGQAFRSPYPIETSFNNNGVFFGDATLQPETIDTADLQVFYRNKETYASVTAFHSVIDDIIRFSGTQYNNGGKAYIRGLTFEVEEQLTKDLKLRGSASYQTSKLDDGPENFDSTPNLLLKAAANYQVNKWLNWDVSNQYIGQNNIDNPFPIVYLNPDSDGYNILTTNLTFDVDELTGLSLGKGTSFSVQGYNLLDEDAFTSTLSYLDTSTGPLRPGRSVYARFKVQF